MEDNKAETVAKKKMQRQLTNLGSDMMYNGIPVTGTKILYILRRSRAEKREWEAEQRCRNLLCNVAPYK